ncbi:MAG: cytoplasmic protein [Magnetococcales bacterium]|nr:cytoplasmic protein [Magnetococcales bacterium]
MTEATPYLSRILVGLMKGVLYREKDPKLWQSLRELQGRASDHVGVLGLDLVVDEAEGYAFLKQRVANADDEAADLPRLVTRRPMGFSVSLLLVLLREKLLEADAKGEDFRLILGRDQIMDAIQLFLPDSTNQAKLMDRLDADMGKIVDMGFLRPLPGQEGQFEVRRILKAFVDAQWLGDFNQRLSQYRTYLAEMVASGKEGA